tara:strand:+ start:3316 stop:4209 length:894 start_codon:yes stop_codon:yes gene_type:complete
MSYKNIKDLIGNTPLVKLKNLPGNSSNIILVKLEGNNPAGSIKDRAALSMLEKAEKRGDIKPGDTLIEATSGNTGIALAMVAAMKGYKLILVMPDGLSKERMHSMLAYGAEIITTDKKKDMEGARDLASLMEKSGDGFLINQFDNSDNALAHYETTGPEIWQETKGKVSHFIASMGTTGTITGVGRYLKEKNKKIQVIGVKPDIGSSIPGIKRWPKNYLPKIFDVSVVDSEIDIDQSEAESMAKLLASKEGIFCGPSAGCNVAASLKLNEQVENSLIVSIICDRGDRYISTGIFTSL